LADAELLTLIVDDPDLADADHVVDSEFLGYECCRSFNKEATVRSGRVAHTDAKTPADYTPPRSTGSTRPAQLG
jgi:hypothetical protein